MTKDEHIADLESQIRAYEITIAGAPGYVRKRLNNALSGREPVALAAMRHKLAASEAKASKLVSLIGRYVPDQDSPILAEALEILNPDKNS